MTDRARALLAGGLVLALGALQSLHRRRLEPELVEEEPVGYTVAPARFAEPAIEWGADQSPRLVQDPDAPDPWAEPDGSTSWR